MKVKSVFTFALVPFMLGSLGSYAAWAVESNADMNDVVATSDQGSVDQAVQTSTDEEQPDFGGGFHGGGAPGGFHGGGAPGGFHGGGPIGGGGFHPAPGPVHGGFGPGPIHAGPGPIHGGFGPGPIHAGPGPVHGFPGPIHGDPGFGHPYPIHGGAYPWPVWNHPFFPRPVYYWNWGGLESVTCTAVNAAGEQFPVTNDGYIGDVYQDQLPGIEDAAIDRCYNETGGDSTCHLLDCVPLY
jgi:hypothetical protein